MPLSTGKPESGAGSGATFKNGRDLSAPSARRNSEGRPMNVRDLQKQPRWFRWLVYALALAYVAMFVPGMGDLFHGSVESESIAPEKKK